MDSRRNRFLIVLILIVLAAIARPQPALGQDAIAPDETAIQSDLTLTDALARRAWERAEDKRPSADALRRLHHEPGFRLIADEARVGATVNILGRGFARTETRHFVILSNASPAWTRRRGELLERTHHQFFRAMDRLGLPAIPPEHKLLCVLINDHDDYRAFAAAHDRVDAEWAAGYYATATNRVVFCNDATGPELRDALRKLDSYDFDVTSRRARAVEVRRQGRDDLADRLEASADEFAARIEDERERLLRQSSDFATTKAVHEAVHLLAFNTGVQDRRRMYPFWLSEGLAVSFETADPVAAFGPGYTTEANRASERELHERFIPLAELVSLAEAPAGDADRARAMYAQAGALFDYLYMHQRRALADYFMELAQQPGDATPEQRLATFRRHFGDPARLERKLGW
jgi:hypothetical protein